MSQIFVVPVFLITLIVFRLQFDVLFAGAPGWHGWVLGVFAGAVSATLWWVSPLPNHNDLGSDDYGAYWGLSRDKEDEK